MLFCRLSTGHGSSRRVAAGDAAASSAVNATMDVVAPALRPNVIEPLESRVMFSVSKDSGGWTVVGKSLDTRVIYVSSSAGRDSNSGRSSSRPVRTLARAKALVRSGRSDWVLLKRGDTWRTGFGVWNKSGRSQSAPLLLSAYGTGKRPLINTGDVHAFNTDGSKASHLAIIGLAFHNAAGDPFSSSYQGHSPQGYGLRVVGGTDGLLVEDCSLDAFRNNISFDSWNGSPRNVTIRRNVITDAHNSGIYASGVAGIRIEQNTLDHNGWNERTSVGGVGHNIYLQPKTTGVVVTGNTIARAGSHGLQARGGGTITNNLFYKNGIGMSFGLVNGGPIKVGGVSGTVSGNVFLGTRKINRPGRGWGFGMEIGNTRRDANTTITNNIFAHSGESTSAAMYLAYGSNVSNAGSVGINDLTISNNIVYDWSHAISLKSGMVAGGRGAKALNDLVVKFNQFQMPRTGKQAIHASAVRKSEESWRYNTYAGSTSSRTWYSIEGRTVSLSTWRSRVESTARSSRIRYYSPSRTLESYNDSVVGGTRSGTAFLSAARTLSDTSWRTSLTADKAITYIRNGFRKV